MNQAANHPSPSSSSSLCPRAITISSPQSPSSSSSQMDSLDTSWCPGCDRQIIPKRTLVPALAPAPAKRTAKGANKNSEPVVPRKRIVIDQGPTPLYCSDECRIKDMSYQDVPSCFDPARPHGSHSFLVSRTPQRAQRADSSSSDSSSSSSASESSSSSSSKPFSDSPSLNKLAAFYNFSPLPPAPPVLTTFSPIDAVSTSPSSLDSKYESGVMMAARRIRASLGAAKSKKTTPSTKAPSDGLVPTASPLLTSSKTKQRKEAEEKVGCGFASGSAEWRAATYSLSSPNDKADDSIRAPPPPFAHRHSGVVSTASQDACSTSSSEHLSTVASTSTVTSPLTFSRLSSSLPTQSSMAMQPQRRRKALVHPAAQGKLLVPDVTLSVPSPVRSPTRSAASSAQGLTKESSRPRVEHRSWSYDHMYTYATMPMPISWVPDVEARRASRSSSREKRSSKSPSPAPAHRSSVAAVSESAIVEEDESSEHEPGMIPVHQCLFTFPGRDVLVGDERELRKPEWMSRELFPQAPVPPRSPEWEVEGHGYGEMPLH